MGREPVYLAAPLRAVLGDVGGALWAGVEIYKLLAEFFVFSVIVVRVLDRVRLVLPHVLQGALGVFAFAHVDHA